MCQFDVQTRIWGGGGCYPLVLDPTYGLSGQIHLGILGHDHLYSADNTLMQKILCRRHIINASFTYTTGLA